MEINKDLLLRSGARLYSLGIDVDGAREALRKLVEQGTPYDSIEMIEALNRFQELEQQWKTLEQDFLRIKSELT